MNLSQFGFDFIKSHEAIRTRTYYDTGNPPIPTIGIGHTGPDVTDEDVHNGKVISLDEVYSLFKQDLNKFENYVKNYVTVSLTQGQYDALVSFCFNIGPGNFHSSTLLRKLNSGDYQGASSEFARWNKDDGVVVSGLVNRRRDETNMFNS